MNIDFIINLLEPTKNIKNKNKAENFDAAIEHLTVHTEFPVHILVEFPVHILVRILLVRSPASLLFLGKCVNRDRAIDHNEFVSSQNMFPKTIGLRYLGTPGVFPHIVLCDVMLNSTTVKTVSCAVSVNTLLE